MFGCHHNDHHHNPHDHDDHRDDGQVRDGGSLAGHHVGRHRWETLRPKILQQVRFVRIENAKRS